MVYSLKNISLMCPPYFTPGENVPNLASSPLAFKQPLLQISKRNNIIWIRNKSVTRRWFVVQFVQRTPEIRAEFGAWKPLKTAWKTVNH